MTDQKTLNVAIGEAFSHLRDCSLRDGIQSWDANKWSIDEIIPVAKELDKLAVLLKSECGAMLPPVEIWGGGQFAQPAKFGGKDGLEDPLINLTKLHTAAPNLDFQCLYRGRQALGFIPVSEEIQRDAIHIAADEGIKVFRIFDMMNDIDNVKTGIHAVKEYQQTHPDVKVEAAISYISEPQDSAHRAWTLEDYGNYAVDLAREGADAIAIKNFAGVGDYESKALIETIRAKLDAAGYKDMSINLHSHGEKPPVLHEAIKAGAGKVDVAIGDLSGGPSHTNIRSILKLLLEDKKIDIDSAEVKNHPVMHQLCRVEAAIEQIVRAQNKPRKNGNGQANGNGHGAATMQSFLDRRALLSGLNPELIEKYRMAGGAFSDLTSRIDTQHQLTAEEKNALFTETLEKGAILWERAGRFNTVTPGAKILVDQALKLVGKKGKTNMTDYDDAFMDVVTGRFGKNRGMGEGIEEQVASGERQAVGDVKWRDALMMFRALKIVDKEMRKDSRSELQMMALLKKAEPQGILKDGKGIQLADERLESNLMRSDIAKFKAAVKEINMEDSVKQALLAELTLGRKKTPTAGLEAGKEVLRTFEEKNPGVIAQAQTTGKLSSDDQLPTLAMLLREAGNGGTQDATFGKLVSSIAGVKTEKGPGTLAAEAGSNRESALVAKTA